MDLVDYRSTGVERAGRSPALLGQATCGTNRARGPRYKELLGRERDDAVRRVDVDAEAIEEIAAEQPVAGARDFVGADVHPAHARLADLERLDRDEVDVVAARDAAHARRGHRPRE